MEDFMKTTREELKEYEKYLQDDIHQFNSKLNLTRKDLNHYFDQQIEYLRKIQSDFNQDLDYLEEENNKTCRDNEQEFQKLCLSINQNNHHPPTVSKLFKEFKQNFPMRPKIIKSIPQYHFEQIQINDLIIQANSSSPLQDKSVLNEPSNHSFIPIDAPVVDDTQISSLPTTSIGSSYHKQLAAQNTEKKIEDQSRVVSSCSTMSEGDSMVDMIFRIPYEHSWTPHLMCFNEDEKYLLIYLFSSHQFQCLSLNSHRITSINYPCDQSILNLGYSRTSHLFYYSTRQNNRFVLFRLNEQEKQIEIQREIELINEKDHFINVHIYENCIFYLYLISPFIVMLGKYNLESSSILPPIRLRNIFDENGEKCYYRIIDFTLNNSFICYLIQFKTKTKTKILIHDYESMNLLQSFDLVDAVKPISIVSTEKESGKTTMTNGYTEPLLYINDPDGRSIHCCTYQDYLTTVCLANFGFCSLDDGHLVIIAKKDIRVLNVQGYFERNKTYLH